MAKKPVEINLPEKIVKLASGYDFVLFLSETGHVYSCGNGETGQLARLNRYAAEDGLRGGIGKTIHEIFPSLEHCFSSRSIDSTSTHHLQSHGNQSEEFII